MGEASRQISVHDLLSETVRQFPEAQRACIVMDTPDGEVVLFLSVQATVQSLVALLQNALDATAPGGTVALRAIPGSGEITFEVSDLGHGMPEDVLRRIAEPFFTTKEPGQGMGLGTFLVRTFAERLGGRLSFESTAGKGTTATLSIPSRSARHEIHAPV